MSKFCSKSEVKLGDLSSQSSDDDDDHQKMEAFQTLPDIDVANIAPGFTLQGSIAHFDGGTLHATFQGTQFATPLSWNNLSYIIKDKHILRRLTGTALPSRCLAIMGSSGAGKTTFLNAISDRLAMSPTMRITGLRQIGDVEYRHHYRKAMGFVPQDDILSYTATPDSALRFSLRVRRGTTVEQTKLRVEEVLQELHLLNCRKTVVGTPGVVAGLSGGERKRCNIGVELICDPKILLLDEPTSGMDSVTAAKIVHLLSELARKGRTVIYTIHQPTAETLTYFDDLMLLTEGRCAYHGTMANSVPYFESIGYPCPDTFTPTDYFMTLLQDHATAKILTKKWKSYLRSVNRMPHTVAIKLHEGSEEAGTTKFLKRYIESFGSSVGIQFTELVRRNAIELLRSRMYIIALMSHAVFFALIMGLIFLKVGDDVPGVQDRQGLLFMVAVNRAMGPALVMIDGFPREKPLFIREQQTGAYCAFVYFIAKTLVEFPVRIMSALLECIILYWMAGLTSSASAFFYYFGVAALLTEVSASFGFAMSASTPNLVVASAITSMILIPMILVGGLLASTSRLRPYWYWLEKISFIRYAYILLVQNEFENVHHIHCDSNVYGPIYCNMQAKNGQQVLARMGFDDEESLDWIIWISLGVLYFVFSCVVVIALYFSGRSRC